MDITQRTLTLTWDKLTPAWNASADKRFKEALELVDPPAVIDDDSHPLTRFEYFEKENNVTLSGSYQLTFHTPQDLTMFVLKWL